MEGQILFGKYKIQREIARGGMGMVCLALDITLDRQVAIKVLHAQYSGDPSFVERFLREGRAMARLDHQNIIRVYAVEEEKGSHYIVMEFFPGKDLKQLVRDQGKFSIDAIINIGIKVAEALENAHAQRIVHRDIKPANIMVDDQGRVKIADFGIAAALEEASLTATGTVIGTPLFMSPEQAKFGSVDARSDLYSLGMVLYELATGQTPFQGMPAHTILGKLAYEPGELPLTFPEGFPGSVQNILLTLLKKDPDERIQSARELALRLKACSAESSLSSIGEGETMVISDEPFLPEKDVGRSQTTHSAATIQASDSAPLTPSTVPPLSSKMSVSPGGDGAQPGPGKKISPALIGAGVGICLLIGGLVFFLARESPEDVQELRTSQFVEVDQQTNTESGGKNEEASTEIEVKGSQNTNDLVKADLEKAKNELGSLKKEYDDEHQLNVRKGKEFSGKTQAVLTKLASIPDQPQVNHASELTALQVDLMGIKNQITALNTNQKNTKEYLTKKERSLIERIHTLKTESLQTYKNLTMETQVQQLSNSRDAYEDFHRKSSQKPLDLLAKAETELLRKKSSLDKQMNVAERERQEVVGKAQQALLSAQQELREEQTVFLGAMTAIEEKIVAAKGEGALLRSKEGEIDVKAKTQNLRQQVQGLKRDFKKELQRHQAKGQAKLETADGALAMAEAARSKALAQSQLAKIEDARSQLMVTKQDFLVTREQKEIQVKSLLGQVASLFQDLDLMIAKKEKDQGAQRQMIAEAVYQDLSLAKEELEGEKNRYQVTIKGLTQRINKTQEEIQGLASRSELDGTMNHVEILRQDLRMIEEHIGQELNRVKNTGSSLIARVEDAISKGVSAKAKASSELESLGVGKLQKQVAEAKNELMKSQAQDIQNLNSSFQLARTSLDKSASLLAQKLEDKAQKQAMVGSLIEQLKGAQKQYQDQHDIFRKSRQKISKSIQGILTQAHNIGDSPTQSRKNGVVQGLRQEVQDIAKKMKDLDAKHRKVKGELENQSKSLVENVDKKVQQEADGQVKLKFALALQEMKTTKQQFESGSQLQMKMQTAELAEVHNVLDTTEQALAHANEAEEEERLTNEKLASQTKNELVALLQDIDNKRMAYQNDVNVWNEKLVALKRQVGVTAQSSSQTTSGALSTFSNELRGFQKKVLEAQQQNSVEVQSVERKVQDLLGKNLEVKKKAPSEYSQLQLDTFSKHLSEAQSEFRQMTKWHDGEMQNLSARVDAELQKDSVTPSTNAAGLDNILKSFQVAYEQKDLGTLRQITSMKSTRERFLKTLFDRHANVQISTEIRGVSPTEAKARVLITKLIGLNGKPVKINRIIKETTVTIPKEGKKWGKIQW